MVLTDREIETALKHGQLVIRPYPKPEALTSTALDLTLSPRIRVWRQSSAGGVDLIVNPSDPKFSTFEFQEKHTEPVDLSPEGYVVSPGQFLLAWTAETIELPFSSRIAARVEGKSSLARLGLSVHITAPTIHSGFKGPVQLEVCNHGQWKVRVVPGMRVCQLIFETTLGTPNAGYRGQFQGQEPS